LSQNTKDSKLSYSVNQKSLSHLVYKWYRVVTDQQMDERTEGRMDRITVANMRYSYARSHM